MSFVPFQKCRVYLAIRGCPSSLGKILPSNPILTADQKSFQNALQFLALRLRIGQYPAAERNVDYEVRYIPENQDFVLLWILLSHHRQTVRDMSIVFDCHLFSL